MHSVWVATILCLTAMPALAQTTPREEQGAALAAKWCAECHAIGGESQARALTGAPSFADIAARGAATPDNLRRQLLGDHPVMPEFPVTGDEIQALADYINTVKATSTRAEAPTQPQPDAHAQTEAVRAGSALVSENCAPCHALEGDGPSPVSDAPVFSRLSERYPVEYLAEALAEGILVGHPEVAMPEFVFMADEVTAIIAYLNSIQVR